MPHVAVYLRISSDPRDLRAGVERQHPDCLAIAAAKFPGVPVTVYEDNDRSAWQRNVVRHEYQRMLRDLAAGELIGLVAWDQDRLLRTNRELEPLIDLCEAHRFHGLVTAQGDIDLTTEDGRFKARIMAAVAQKSSDATSRRVRRSIADRQERGKWHGGIPPYGYVLDAGQLIVDEDAAVHVRAAVASVLAGGSVRSLIDPARPNSPRTLNGWKALLQSPTLAGRTRNNHRGAWPAILDEGTYARLLLRLNDPERTTPRTAERVNWLSGVLRCGRCDAGMVVYNRGKMQCPRCFRVSVSVAAVEPYVVGFVYARGSVIVEPAVALPPTVEDPRLTELALDYYVNRTLTRDAFNAARSAIQSAPPQGPRVAAKGRELPTPDVWPTLLPREKYELALQALRGVWVLPATRRGRVFDPSRLDPRYR